MKKIKNSEQLIMEKKLLELEQLQLEKQIRHTLKDMQQAVSKPVSVSSLLQQIPALAAKKAGEGFLKRLAGWVAR